MKLKPIIAQCALAGVMSLPVAAHAVGLGKLTVQSGLGQPLVAEIDLVSVQSDELQSLTAKVADPATYKQNNLEYQSALTRVRVNVAQRSNGQPYLKVSSPQPVNDPFLGLLIEVNWATGRLVREYTFLLDPPGYAAVQAVEPATPVQAQVLPSTSRPTVTASPKPATKPAEGTPSGPASGEYPVKRGDTLSKIAAKVKPEDVTVEQMMMALFRTNKDAFEGGNINRLRSGQILTVPSREQVAAIEPADAVKLVKIQASDWRSYRDRVAATAPRTDDDESKQSAAGKITTQVAEKVPQGESSRDKLKLSKGQPVDAKVVKQAQEDLIAKEKALKEANERVAQLEKTVADLQRLLAVNSSAAAKAQQAPKPGEPAKVEPPKPAGTQTVPPVAPAPGKVEPPKPEPQKTTVAKAEPPKPEPAKVEPPKVEAAKPAEPPKVEPLKPAEPPKPEPAKAPEPAAATPPAQPPVAQTPTPTPPPAEAPKPTPPKPAVPKPVAPPPPVETAWYDELPGGPAVVFGAGGVLVLGGVALAYMAYRRRKAASAFEDSIITGGDLKTNTVFGNTGGGIVNTGDNSFITDFSREGLGNIDTDEVDPIAEAEVYLAYGRDAQAEEILKDAIQKTPDRHEVHVKLLEIYAQNGKASAFETLATELYAATGGQGPHWARAVELGHQLDPQNPLYAAGANASSSGGAALAAGAALAGAGAMAAMASRQSDDLDFDLGEPAEPTVKMQAKAPEPEDALAKTQIFTVRPDLMGDTIPGAPVDDLQRPVASAPAPASTPPEPLDDLGLDFNLDLPSSGPAPAPAPAAAAPAPAGGNDLEFDLGLDFDAAPAPAPAAAPASSINDLDFDLPQGEVPPAEPPTIELTAPEWSEPAPSLGETVEIKAVAAPEPMLDLDFKLDSLDEHDFAPPPATPANDFSGDLGTVEAAPAPDAGAHDAQWQETATKLDLAKAYQEMGDIEGAREILQEVINEGDAIQKKEAQELVNKLEALV